MVKLNFAYINEKNLIIGKKYCFVSEYYFYNKELIFVDIPKCIITIIHGLNYYVQRKKSECDGTKSCRNIM